MRGERGNFPIKRAQGLESLGVGRFTVFALRRVGERSTPQSGLDVGLCCIRSGLDGGAAALFFFEQLAHRRFGELVALHDPIDVVVVEGLVLDQSLGDGFDAVAVDP